MHKGYYSSPIGLLEIQADKEKITHIDFVDEKANEEKDKPFPEVIKECIRQLEEYFGGKRKTFAIPLELEGTDFQKTVWQKLTTIPYGKTISYKELAIMVGKPDGYRAVGNANGQNRIVILVPCHRVIQSDGKLGGYGGGLHRKEWLLKFEQGKTDCKCDK